MQPSGKGDEFRVVGEVLTGFAGDQASSLSQLRQAIDLHRAAWRAANARAARQSFGIEIGAGVAKFFVKRWTLEEAQPRPSEPAAWTGKTIVDAKMRLVKRADMEGPDVEYRNRIAEILDAFDLRAPAAAQGDWLIPARRFDFDSPGTLLKDCPPGADIAYVYGTHGPRAAAALAEGPLFGDTMRILSGDEEGLLIFNAIVPRAFHERGAMAIEIGSGSTELALIGVSGRKHAITFALGGQSQAGLAAIVRGIETGDIVTHAARHLESDPASAAHFINDARQFFAANNRAAATLFINPNEQSAAMRTKAARNGTAITIDAIERYAKESPTAPFAPKAKILAALARAFHINTVQEGAKGGLKEAMAQFIGEALGKADGAT